MRFFTRVSEAVRRNSVPIVAVAGSGFIGGSVYSEVYIRRRIREGAEYRLTSLGDGLSGELIDPSDPRHSSNRRDPASASAGSRPGR